MINGVASSLECAVSGTSQLTCVDTVDVVVSAGALINVRIVPTSQPDVVSIALFSIFYTNVP